MQIFASCPVWANLQSSSDRSRVTQSEVPEREGDKTEILKERWEHAGDWWSCKFSPNGGGWYQELRLLSRVPFVSAWLQFINLRDANSYISPLTPQPVLRSAGTEEHSSCLHARWHQLESRSLPFEKPFSQRIWLLLTGRMSRHSLCRRREGCQASHFYVAIRAYVGSLLRRGCKRDDWRCGGRWSAGF